MIMVSMQGLGENYDRIFRKKPERIVVPKIYGAVNLEIGSITWLPPEKPVKRKRKKR